MIAVRCGSCEETFEVGDECAGLTEFCPACGALNDIPPVDADEMEQPGEAEFIAPAGTEFTAPAESDAGANSAIMADRPVVRGIPAGLWWAGIVLGIGTFIVACFFLFSNNWESEHVGFLSDAVGRGDTLMVEEDFAGAVREYRSALDAVGSRPIQSTFIRQLLDHARQNQADARTRLRLAATTAPSLATAGSAAGSSAGPAAAAQPADADREAIRDFQRECEGFAEYARSRPVLFLDDRRNWRRRQYMVWDVSYEPRPASDPPEMLVRYSCRLRITEPHDARGDAADDPNFADDEQSAAMQCQTLFALHAGEWAILHRQVDSAGADGGGAKASEPGAASLGELYRLEEQAFHARVAGGALP